jgi:hypothetical protein
MKTEIISTGLVVTGCALQEIYRGRTILVFGLTRREHGDLKIMDLERLNRLVTEAKGA